MNMTLFDMGSETCVPSPDLNSELGQFFTPRWVAARLVELYFQNLSASNLILEPACGDGAFLQAIPAEVPAIGVEIDPYVAERARIASGRKVIDGDFGEVGLPEGVSHVIGNPPFDVELLDRFLLRSYQILPPNGRAGFLTAAYVFQTFSRVVRWSDQWSLKVDLLPRNIFPNLRLPLVFATFDKRNDKAMVGFALYREAAEIAELSAKARNLLHAGKPRIGVWQALVEETLKALGGRANLSAIYEYIEPKRPTETRWWKEQVRKVLQQHFVSCGSAMWALAD